MLRGTGALRSTIPFLFSLSLFRIVFSGTDHVSTPRFWLPGAVFVLSTSVRVCVFFVLKWVQSYVDEKKMLERERNRLQARKSRTLKKQCTEKLQQQLTHLHKQAVSC